METALLSGDDPHRLDDQRRRELHARHALSYPASLNRDVHSTTFLAIRPVGGEDVPCKVDLRKHGIEGGQGLYANPFAASGGVGMAETELTHRYPLQPLDRASVLRLFGLAGTGPGDLVDDLGAVLAEAWSAAGLGGHMDEADLVLTARSWEAERMAACGLAELRGMLPSRFAEAAILLAMPATAKRMMFGDHAINILVRDEAFCAFVASLGGLAPLLLERPVGLDHSAFDTPAEFVREALRTAYRPAGGGPTLEEAGWLHHTFAGLPSLMVTESLAATLVGYRRALGFHDLGTADRAALIELVDMVDGAGAEFSHRGLFSLMGDLGVTHGTPAAFLSGVERHRAATGDDPRVLADRVTGDAGDFVDAVWNAFGSKAARAVADLRDPSVFPMMLWDTRDRAANAFVEGVGRLSVAATHQGKGSEGLLAAAYLWVRAGRPGYEAGKLGGLGRRTRFRDIELAKDKADNEHEAILGFLRDRLGIDLEPKWMALATQIAAMGLGTHDRWLRQDYPEPAPAGVEGQFEVEAVSPALPHAQVPGHVDVAEVATTAPEQGGAEPVSDAVEAETPAAPGSWWKRAATLGQALAARRGASGPA